MKQLLGLPLPAVANQGKAASAEALATAISSGKPIQTFATRPAAPVSQTARQKRAANPERRAA